MNDQFVPYEIAKQLIAKGFDEPCLGGFNDKKQFNLFGGYFPIRPSSDQLFDYCVAAPLWQQVVDWFRTTHHIYLKVEPTDFINDWCKTYFAAMWHTHSWFKRDDFETYEEAKLFLFTKAMELI